MKKPEALCLRPWVCLGAPGNPSRRDLVFLPMVREWLSVLTAVVVFVLTAFTPEDRCFWVFPIRLDDVEVDALDDLLAGDLVAAIAAFERPVWLYA